MDECRAEKREREWERARTKKGDHFSLVSLSFLSDILSLRQSSTWKIVQNTFQRKCTINLLIFVLYFMLNCVAAHCINVIYQVKWWMVNKCALVRCSKYVQCTQSIELRDERLPSASEKWKINFVQLFIVKRLVVACVCHFNEFRGMKNFIAAATQQQQQKNVSLLFGERIQKASRAKLMAAN